MYTNNNFKAFDRIDYYISIIIYSKKLQIFKKTVCDINYFNNKYYSNYDYY